jgi:hypothetical protein
MSLLYKDPKDVKTSVKVETYIDGKVKIIFHNNGGKHGTDEMLAIYKLTSERLLQILNDRDDITDDEI